MILAHRVTPDNFPTWEEWSAQEPDADYAEWQAWRREVCGQGRKVGPNRRQTVYRVQWKRSTSSAQARIFTKRSAALAKIEQIKNPDDKRGRGVRPLEFVRLFTGSVVWDDCENIA